MASSNSSVPPIMTIDPSNTLYLHPSDHPGIILVSKFFDDAGLVAWKRVMTITLSAKNKHRFINNTLTMLNNEQQLAVWQRCNDMVILLILNTLTRDTSDSVLYAKTAQILWKELNSHYGQANDAKFYQLQKKPLSNHSRKQ
ncbi:uncharacterized protein LOC143576686 [Bidens hawaiensis]|uniref:uncharacterized protein LOC143576686 n=1 Tax=Bidens hawaiensis TaxID=980011 RepID=UPI00404A1B24